MVDMHVSNRRVSWGRMLRITRLAHEKKIYGPGSARVVLVVVWLMAIFSAIALHRSGAGLQTPAALIGVGSALGGAAGNLLDILLRRSIVDFIDLGWWPAFNLADIGIVGGLVLALWPAR